VSTPSCHPALARQGTRPVSAAGGRAGGRGRWARPVGGPVRGRWARPVGAARPAARPAG